jgi:hypothetical protein
MNRSEKKLARKSYSLGKWALIVGVFSLMIGFVTYCKSSDAGAFAKSEIQVLFAGQQLESTGTNSVFYGIPYTSMQNYVTLAKIPLIIESKGEKSVQEMEVEIVYPNDISISPELVPLTAQSFSKQTKYIKQIGEKVTSFKFAVSSADPGSFGLIEEVVQLAIANAQEPLGTTQDGKTFGLRWAAVISKPIQIIVTGKDMSRQSYFIKLFPVGANSKDELEISYSGIKTMRRSSTPIHERILDSVLSATGLYKDKDMLVYPDKIKSREVEGGYVFIVDTLQLATVSDKQ